MIVGYCDECGERLYTGHMRWCPELADQPAYTPNSAHQARGCREERSLGCSARERR